MQDFNLVTGLTVLTVLITLYAWSKPEMQDAWTMRPYTIARDPRQAYRFVTSGFLHGQNNWAHLLFNMVAFYSFGRLVLDLFQKVFGGSLGNAAFLLLYLGGIIVSDLPTYFRHRDDYGYGSLGASGGVSSVIFATILYDPTGGIIFPLLPGMPIPGFIWGGLYLAYSQYMGRRGGDNINHDAHFYGAVFGVIVAGALIPQSLSAFFPQIQDWIQSKF